MWTWRKIGTAAAVVSITIAATLIVVDQIALPWIVSTSDTVRVPSVIGKKESTAEYLLSQLGLQVKDVRYQHSPSVQPGVVMSQLPSEGSIVKEGRRVYLTVSKGLETVSMPNLVGQSLGQARRQLARMGLQVGSISSVVSSDYPAETIAWQSIPAGSQVSIDAAINLGVSQGAELRMPYIIGMQLEEARAALSAIGVQIGAISERSTKAFTAGTIIEQEPPADSVVSTSVQVRVILAR
ncbi:MAG: PASTA domain-containing protein [Candidatus Kapabacteria bacterium]|nr:PASTA domain-containing protein [Candidatus Kapabacteria bacterium]